MKSIDHNDLLWICKRYGDEERITGYWDKLRAISKLANHIGETESKVRERLYAGDVETHFSTYRLIDQEEGQ